MALIHRAFTFDVDKLERKLQPAIVNGRLEPLALFQLAVQVVEKASSSTIQVLDWLRFDQDWLNISDTQTMRSHLWSLINLADLLSPSPSLSDNHLGSYSVLKLILPLAGWSDTDVNTMIVGSPLSTLLKILNDSLSEDDYVASKQLHGYGWISLEEVQNLLYKLKQSEGYFLNQVEESSQKILQWTEASSATLKEDSKNLLRYAYADGINMLQASVSKQQPLFLTLD